MAYLVPLMVPPFGIGNTAPAEEARDEKIGVLRELESSSRGLCAREKNQMRTILLIVLVLLILGALPTWPYSAGWGYYPSGGFGLLLVVLLILGVLGKL
jgi:Protein of unknown function (DUF3309)